MINFYILGNSHIVQVLSDRILILKESTLVQTLAVGNHLIFINYLAIKTKIHFSLRKFIELKE